VALSQKLLSISRRGTRYAGVRGVPNLEIVALRSANYACMPEAPLAPCAGDNSEDWILGKIFRWWVRLGWAAVMRGGWRMDP